MLNISDSKLVGIFALSGALVTKADISAYLTREDETGYRECPHELMSQFLNGLVIYRRGINEGAPPLAVEVPITNNVVLKKLRVAFELKDVDIITLIAKCGLRISKTELSAFFRRPDHRNYRECGDQFLRNLLKGMTP